MRFKIIILIILITFFGCSSNSEPDLNFFNRALRDLNDLNYSEALVNFKKSINTNPTHSESYSYAAGILIEKEEYEEANAILTTGINFSDQNEELYTLLGRTNFLNKNYSDSEEYFKKALELNNSNEEAFSGYILSISRQQRFSELEEIVDEYENKQQSDEFKLIATLVNINNQEKAQSFLTKLEDHLDNSTFEELSDLVQNNSEDIERNMRISRIIINQGYPSLALPYIERVIEQNEFYEGGYLFKGIVMTKLERLKEAKRNLKKSLEIVPELPEAYLFLAKANAIEQDYTGAHNNFEITIELDNSEKYLYEYYVFLKINDPEDKLISVLNELRTLHPTNKEYALEISQQYCIKDGYIPELRKTLDSIDRELLSNLEQEKYKILNACHSYKEGNIDQAIKNINEVLLINKEQLLGYYIEAKIAKENEDSKFDDIKERIIDSDTNGYYSYLIDNLDD